MRTAGERTLKILRRPATWAVLGVFGLGLLAPGPHNSDSARYALSAVAQSEAAVLGLSLTVSLLVAQTGAYPLPVRYILRLDTRDVAFLAVSIAALLAPLLCTTYGLWELTPECIALLAIAVGTTVVYIRGGAVSLDGYLRHVLRQRLAADGDMYDLYLLALKALANRDLAVLSKTIHALGQAPSSEGLAQQGQYLARIGEQVPHEGASVHTYSLALYRLCTPLTRASGHDDSLLDSHVTVPVRLDGSEILMRASATYRADVAHYTGLDALEEFAGRFRSKSSGPAHFVAETTVRVLWDCLRLGSLTPVGETGIPLSRQAVHLAGQYAKVAGILPFGQLWNAYTRLAARAGLVPLPLEVDGSDSAIRVSFNYLPLNETVRLLMNCSDWQSSGRTVEWPIYEKTRAGMVNMSSEELAIEWGFDGAFLKIRASDVEGASDRLAALGATETGWNEAHQMLEYVDADGQRVLAVLKVTAGPVATISPKRVLSAEERVRLSGAVKSGGFAQGYAVHLSREGGSQHANAFHVIRDLS